MMFGMGVIVFLLAYLVLRKPKTVYVIVQPEYHEPKFCSFKLTDQQLEQVNESVEKFLRKYPDSGVGDDFPDIKYKIYGELLSAGKISKEDYKKEIDKILIYLNDSNEIGSP